MKHKLTIIALMLAVCITGMAQGLKSVSILGDSYSTFEGYIPEGYECYYTDERKKELYFELFKNICHTSCCIFSYAPEQLLTTEERKAGIIEKIKALPLVESFELSEKIRANREIAAFIRRLKNNNLSSESEGNYSDVEVVFAQNVEEADKIIEYFKKKGYFIANYGDKTKTKSLLLSPKSANGTVVKALLPSHQRQKLFTSSRNLQRLHHFLQTTSRRCSAQS